MLNSDNRIEGLDALRALACLMVLAFHYEAATFWQAPSQWPGLNSLWLYHGLLGVELFFVISGFVIARSLDSQKIATFIIRRAARLYPTYWVSVVVSGAFLFAVGYAPLWWVAVNLTLVQNFFGFGNLIPPYWSLSYEVWFYIVYAAVARACLTGLLPAFGIVWLIVISYCRLFGVVFSNLQMILIMPLFGQFFFAGIMLHRISIGRRDILTFLCLIGCVVFSSMGRSDWAKIDGVEYFCATLLFVVLVGLVATCSISIPTWISELGKASYSVYLLHLPIVMIFAFYFDRIGVSRFQTILIALVFTILISLITYRWVELPSTRLAKRMT